MDCCTMILHVNVAVVYSHMFLSCGPINSEYDVCKVQYLLAILLLRSASRHRTRILEQGILRALCPVSQQHHGMFQT